MSHQQKLPPENCPSCEFGTFTRNAYWMGKLMLPRDFIDEQRYVMDKLRHHNVTLHGWGVACGLKVVPHETPACQNRFVCVEPGVAVDCCGYDIILPEKECIDLMAVPEIKALKDNNDTATHILQVCIRYRECPTEQVPVLYDDCGCETERCAPNRILESYELIVKVDPDIPTEPVPATPCKDLWSQRAGQCGLCDTPNCVVLATIKDYVVGQSIDGTKIDNDSGRKLLPSSQTIMEVIDCLIQNGGGGGGSGGGQKLTHICAINWKHNDKFGSKAAMEAGGLFIAFDGPVMTVDLANAVVLMARNASGCWCEVGTDLVPGDFKPPCETDPASFTAPKQQPDQVTAVKIVPHAVTFETNLYRVVVKGDFLRDAAGKGVDADHLPPWFPNDKYKTGDGIEGGTFESWFTLE